MLESASWGVCSQGGGCLVSGVCSGQGGLLPGGCSGGGVYAPRGCGPGGSGLGESAQGGGIPACTEADSPVNRMTNRCKNITLAATSLQPVIKIGIVTMYKVSWLSQN